MATDYLSFFNLNDDPFRLTPDTSYFYNSPAHSTALLSLEYCVNQKEGFCILTGEPGTGKTTIIRLFTEKWKERAEIALIMTPRLSPDEFFQAVLDDFKIPRSTTNKNDMLKGFRDFLLDHAARDRRVVIIVDEAQELPAATMEELRLLSNLETEKEKLLQIMLIGQHELCDKLLGNQLRQLNQRITVRVQLNSLTSPESSDYINTRLIRGGNNTLLFNQKAKDLIFELSGGIPRTINLLASRALMSAFLDESREVMGKHVEHGAADVMEAASTSAGSEANTQTTGNRRMLRSKSENNAASGNRFSPGRAMRVLLPLLLTAAAGGVAFMLYERLMTNISVPAGVSAQGQISSARLPNRSSAESALQVARSSSLKSAAIMANKSSVRKLPEEPAVIAPIELPRLTAADSLNSAHDSFNELLKAWKYYTLPRTGKKSAVHKTYLDSLALRRGLKIEPFSGGLDTLVSYNYPAILIFDTGQDGREVYRALINASGDKFTIAPSLAGKTTLTRRELESIWRGQAMIVWKNFSKTPETLPKGTRSKGIVTIQKLLENAGIKTAITGVFDSGTADAIGRFQNSKGLENTGQPNSLTMLLLYNESKFVLHPTLK